MTSSGKQTMSASALRARSIHSTTSFVFPARSPTVGLTCASAILTTQLSLLGRLYHLEGLSYFERLRALSRERQTLLCVGLDPDPDRIEGGVGERFATAAPWCARRRSTSAASSPTAP